MFLSLGKQLVSFGFSNWSVIVVVMLVVLNNLLAGERLFRVENRGVFGGPLKATVNFPQTKETELAFAAGQTEFPSPFSFSFQLEDGALFSPVYLTPERTETSSSTKRALFTYVVQEGETLESLAVKFSLDKETIIWANDLKEPKIKPGDRLIILPVSGVLHRVAQGENLASLAKYYNVSEERIALANNLFAQEPLMPGEKLIIPGGVKKQKLALTQANGLTQGGLRMPTTGWNWGRLHNYNAVDIANSCNTPVYASASGYVEEAEVGGWNNGYGNYIVIRHKNNLKTLYAHLSTVFVSPGAYVNQGDLIGAIGNTGKVDGYTGCHLHFEVRGGVNPFAR